MGRVSRFEDVKDHILDALRVAEATHGKPPTVRAFAERHGCSVSTMHAYLLRLREEGLIQWENGRHRTLRLTPRAFQQLTSPEA